LANKYSNEPDKQDQSMKDTSRNPMNRNNNDQDMTLP